MPPLISAPGRPAWPAFLMFLQRAGQAQQNGQAEARAIWLEATGHLQDFDDDAIGRLTIASLKQRRHEDAIAVAAVIAQLQPEDAAARFRLGYAQQMANRHRDALAPYRHALALDPDLPQLRTNLAGALSLSGGAQPLWPPATPRPRARAISAARHSGHRQRPPGSSRSAGKAGMDLHQQSNGWPPCIAQSKALPQRGQRALFACGWDAGGFMAIQRERPDIRSGNDATSGQALEGPAPLRSLQPGKSSARSSVKGPATGA